MADQRVVVVGGGLAGLSAAVELAHRGLDVTLVERNAHLGGKMNVLEDHGFRFDMGPTIITLPQVLRGIVQRAGRDPADYIELVNLDPQWRCHYEDGTVIDLVQDPDVFARRLDEQFPRERPGAGFCRFLEYSRRMFRLSERVFFYRDVGAVTDMMRQGSGGDPQVLRDVLAMRAHSTVGATVHKMISEPHVRQLSEHFLQYVGSSPFLAPAILSLIAAAQVDHGCWYPMGGTREVARTLERLADELGVQVRTGTGIRHIESDGHRVGAVVLENGSRIEADLVVSNCDVQRTYRELLGTPPAVAAQRTIARRYGPACSGVVLYLGLDRQYDHLAHHNFLFSRRSRDEFDQMYRRGLPPDDPTLYLAVPSRTDAAQAPPGGEALYVLVHTPARANGARWNGEGGLLDAYRPVIVDKLKRFGMDELEKHIVVEHHLTPDHIEHMYNAEGGAIYGLASHGRLRGGFKPRNRSARFDNLYFAGGSVNPGAGVPMVLMSGVTAARAVCEDLDIPFEAEADELSEPQAWAPVPTAS
ncbi:MAG: phytoene desaturase family protein [Planctomycetota bacterium]|jgi:phytoene desaturase